MRGDLRQKLIGQDDEVFMRIARQAVLVSAVPDPCFAEKIETCAMHHFGVRGETVGPKEDRRGKRHYVAHQLSVGVELNRPDQEVAGIGKHFLRGLLIAAQICFIAEWKLHRCGGFLAVR